MQARLIASQPPLRERRASSTDCGSFRKLPEKGNVKRTVSAQSGKNTSLGAVDKQPASAPPADCQSRRETLMTLGGSAFALVAAAVTTNAVTPAPAMAALKDYNFDPDAPIEEVEVQLGTEDGQYVFSPNTLEFTMGRICKLKLRNPSASAHYFTPLEFSEKIFTILVLAGDPAVEVKGAISEVALKAGASATWVFIPIKPGRYPLRCTVKGHDGMVGTLVVKKPSA